ncbi:MAG: DUF1801 domain-containing protein [Anaerolineae bacterium]|jgi:hypothetical protein|nr:DUF1801 domain-containing protein [Anaerolineae bacterium]
MAELKTKLNDGDVIAFLNTIENEQRKKDSFIVLEMMQKLTGMEPKMWGESIVGFDQYHYVYASGREGDWMKIGFSPRKQALTLYLNAGYEERAPELLEKLGKHKTGKGCLYIKKMEDVDPDVLRELIKESLAEYEKAE